MYCGGVRAGDDVPSGEDERDDCCVSAGGTEARNDCGARVVAELRDVRHGGGRREERSNESGRSTGWIWCYLWWGSAVESDVTDASGGAWVPPYPLQI